MRGYCYRTEKQYRQGKKHRGKHNRTPRVRPFSLKELEIAMREGNPHSPIPTPTSQTTNMEVQ